MSTGVERLGGARCDQAGAGGLQLCLMAPARGHRHPTGPFQMRIRQPGGCVAVVVQHSWRRSILCAGVPGERDRAAGLCRGRQRLAWGLAGDAAATDGVLLDRTWLASWRALIRLRVGGLRACSWAGRRRRSGWAGTGGGWARRRRRSIDGSTAIKMGSRARQMWR